MSNLIASRVEQREIRAAKEHTILSFLLDEGYSTSKILALVLNMTPNGMQRILRAMEVKQLIKAHQAALPLSERKFLIWGLTPTGASLVIPKNELLRFFEVGRVKPVTMEHSLALQRVKAIALRSGWLGWESSSRLLRKANLSRSQWCNVPDAVALSPHGRKVAIELERTIKTPKRYVQILANYAEMLNSGLVSEVFYICPDALVKRLERQFNQIEKIIVQKRVVTVHESLLKRFHFISYTAWETKYVV